MQSNISHWKSFQRSICRDGDFVDFFGAAKAGLWMGTYQLHVIACYLDLSRVRMKWNLWCHSTNCVFFSKSVPIPVCSHFQENWFLSPVPCGRSSGFRGGGGWGWAGRYSMWSLWTVRPWRSTFAVWQLWCRVSQTSFTAAKQSAYKIIKGKTMLKPRNLTDIEF